MFTGYGEYPIPSLAVDIVGIGNGSEKTVSLRGKR